MTLSDSDLSQLDSAYLDKLPEGDLRPLSKQLLDDLKEARERLNRTPETSSCPPSSRAPWKGVGFDDKETSSPPESSESKVPRCDETSLAETPDADEKATSDPETNPPASSGRTAGRQKDSRGHSRNVTLPVTRTEFHRPDVCVHCGEPFASDIPCQVWTARYELELATGRAENPQLQVEHIRHDYLVARCRCGHETRAEPGRCPDDSDWQVALTEWHLCGSRLVSFLVCLALHLRVSRRKIQVFLRDWLGVELSTSTLNQCIHEAGRAVAPVVDEQLVPALTASELLHIDETPWKESGQLCWLWVFINQQTVVYQVGKRHRQVVQQLLTEAFNGFLMTDGYSVYRVFPKRLRCWAHLIRKAKALRCCLDSGGQAFGEPLLLVMFMLIRNIHQRHESSEDADALKERNQHLLNLMRTLCETHREGSHEGSRKLAGEFLNDWEAIIRVVDKPSHPLTNNLAERSLRHWVLLRKITFGSRTAQGSRVIALLASVIDTARLRQLNPWDFIARTVADRRKNQPAPLLPPMPVSA